MEKKFIVVGVVLLVVGIVLCIYSGQITAESVYNISPWGLSRSQINGLTLRQDLTKYIGYGAGGLGLVLISVAAFSILQKKSSQSG